MRMFGRQFHTPCTSPPDWRGGSKTPCGVPPPPPFEVCKSWQRGVPKGIHIPRPRPIGVKGPWPGWTPEIDNFRTCSGFVGLLGPQDRLYDRSLRNFYITWNYGSIRNLRKCSKYQILKNQGINKLHFPKMCPGLDHGPGASPGRRQQQRRHDMETPDPAQDKIPSHP